MKIELDMYQTLALAVPVLMLGKFLRERVRLLDKFCIPAPVIGGVLFAKLLNIFLPKGRKINPMVGGAGISAFPMSARVIQKMALKEDNQNHLLMHAVGANVAGQIGSVVAGGIILSLARTFGLL